MEKSYNSEIVTSEKKEETVENKESSIENEVGSGENEASEKEYQIEEAEANYDNKDFMLQAIKDNATWVFAYASERLLSDKELILQAVAVDGQVLYYTSKELRDDKDVVLEAVKNKWLTIKYASKRLRSDKDIAINVLTQNTDSSIYLTDEILKNPEVDAILNKKEE